MMLREVVLLLVVVMVVVVSLVVVSTVDTVRDGCFTGSRTGLDWDGGVALVLRWGPIAACRRVHGLVRLCWTLKEGKGRKVT